MKIVGAIGLLVTALLLTGCARGSVEQEKAIAALSSGATLIDVRTAEEFAGGHLDQALRIGHESIVEGVAKLGLSKEEPIVLYCRSGNRSGKAKTALENAGYHQVINAGGYDSLRQRLPAD